MGVWIPGSLIGVRNRSPISDDEAEKIRDYWSALGGDPARLVINHQAESRTYFSDEDRKVHIGADVFPGHGADPNTIMSWQASLTHEYQHLQRHDAGRSLPPGHLDEAITDLEASQYNLLSRLMKNELVADALQRLYLLAKEPRK